MTALHPRIDRAEELLDEIVDALELADVPDRDKVLVTFAAADVHKTANQKQGVILLMPGPDMTYPDPGIALASWQIKLVGSAQAPLLDTWRRLDTLLRAIELHFELARARPGVLPGPQGQSDLPLYTVTLAETTQN